MMKIWSSNSGGFGIDRNCGPKQQKQIKQAVKDSLLAPNFLGSLALILKKWFWYQ
jgi:hypothetical protein